MRSKAYDDGEEGVLVDLSASLEEACCEDEEDVGKL